VILVHGEVKSAQALALAIGKESDVQVVVPEPGQTVTVAGTI
jgi:hypothetical protein